VLLRSCESSLKSGAPISMAGGWPVRYGVSAASVEPWLLAAGEPFGLQPRPRSNPPRGDAVGWLLPDYVGKIAILHRTRPERGDRAIPQLHGFKGPERPLHFSERNHILSRLFKSEVRRNRARDGGIANLIVQALTSCRNSISKACVVSGGGECRNVLDGFILLSAVPDASTGQRRRNR